ncbi:hypothetical protein AXF42_Ash010500 [Apostasia shenzhenica]|uniref:Fluoride ion transporter CrcB n=1 Tax=Apostasia shenzhenica TaxID=1088818 RepID=A0A2I0BE67_9ASPA|nr:hypothetical protein AXF42_Ash010500 [Apostasia shenzhenica]
MFIVNECIYVGVESAGWLRRTLLMRIDNCSERSKSKLKHVRVHTFKQHITIMITMLVILATLWSFSVALASKEFDSLSSTASLWLGCLVGPCGVWARWHLAKLNGKGLGKKGSLKWLPVGTFSANVLAACLMAALSIISKAVNTTKFKIIVNGVEFGFLGCMSTVSTFVAEVYAMRSSGHPGRALAYATLTILSPFVIGTLIFTVPVRIKHYT